MKGAPAVLQGVDAKADRRAQRGRGAKQQGAAAGNKEDQDYGDSALICQVCAASLECGFEMSDDANNAELATQIQPSGHIRYGV
jgi:hypothetical protein